MNFIAQFNLSQIPDVGIDRCDKMLQLFLCFEENGYCFPTEQGSLIRMIPLQKNDKYRYSSSTSFPFQQLSAKIVTSWELKEMKMSYLIEVFIFFF
jgi:hypothetical protein